MKLAFSTLGCPDWSLKYAIEQASSLGFQAIEIRGIKDCMRADTIEELLPENRGESLRYAKENGITICGLNASASFHEKEKRESNMEEALATVRLAAECNVPYVRIFGNNLVTKNEEEEIADIGAAIRPLCLSAQELGVEILLEVHGDFNTGDRILRLAQAVNCESFGIIWDIWHSREDIKTFWKKTKPLVRHVHLKDCRNGELCSLGDGELPVKEVVKLLLGDGYNGYFSFEWEKRWHQCLRGPEEEFPYFVEKMKEIFTEI